MAWAETLWLGDGSGWEGTPVRAPSGTTRAVEIRTALALIRAGFRRHATYRQATVASATTEIYTLEFVGSVRCV